MEKDFIQRLTQAATLAGLGLYAALRFGQQIYCDTLGISPEEIGLTYLASISRAAVILIALGAPLVLLVTVIVLNGPLQGTNWLSRVLEWLIFFVSIAIVSTILILSGILLEQSAGQITIEFLIIATLIIVATQLVSRRPRHGPLFTFRQDKLGQLIYSKRTPLLILTFVAGLTVAAFFITGFAAQRQARNVQSGSSVGFGSTLNILGIQANPVKLTGNVPKDPNFNKRRMMYLGEAGGRIVLYDIGCGKPIRIPEDGVTVVVMKTLPTDETTGCPD